MMAIVAYFYNESYCLEIVHFVAAIRKIPSLAYSFQMKPAVLPPTKTWV